MTRPQHSFAHAEYSGRVLLVDDNDRLRRMLSLALQTAGFAVVEAGTQLELQRRLIDVHPDAMVLDLQRSEADGLDLLTRMRARPALRDVPILFLAGDDDDEFRWQVQRAGADWFGLRPVGMLALQNQVAQLIRDGRSESHERLPRPPTPIRVIGYPLSAISSS